MAADQHTVELRLGAGTRGAAVAGPLVLALGSRAGLTVQELDEVELALELLLRGRCDGPATVTIAVDDGSLVVTIAPVAEEFTRRRAALLTQLAGRLSVDGDRVELRAGG
jgi:hypothetical protein